MELSTIVFHMNSQPDFDELKRKGWRYPEGLRGEEVTHSLVKDFKDAKTGVIYQIQVVRHQSDRWKYTEAFVHDRREEAAVLKGQGIGMPKDVAISLISKLYDEFG